MFGIGFFELVTLGLRYDHLPGTDGLEKLIEEATLMSDQDNLQEARGVKLMTILLVDTGRRAGGAPSASPWALSA